VPYTAAKGQIPVAVISESVWRTRFRADPRVINGVAQINYRPVIVIGVVPDSTAGWAQHFSLRMRIDAQEPLLYCGAALMLGAAAVLAMLDPAPRGANSDPPDALRCE